MSATIVIHGKKAIIIGTGSQSIIDTSYEDINPVTSIIDIIFNPLRPNKFFTLIGDTVISLLNIYINTTGTLQITKITGAEIPRFVGIDNTSLAMSPGVYVVTYTYSSGTLTWT